MKDIFLRAAEFMDTPASDAGCCHAIRVVGGYGTNAYLPDIFARMYRPQLSGGYWFGPPQDWLTGKRERTVRQTRVLALLLAAEAWKDFE